jgi:hypothetical protein
MTVQQFFKGLLMALISVLVIAFGQQPVEWALLAVTAIAAILAYTGKNLIGLVSTSDEGKFNWINFLSALLVLLATGITESLAMIVVDHKIAVATLLKVCASVTLTYITATFFGPPTKAGKKLF